MNDVTFFLRSILKAVILTLFLFTGIFTLHAQKYRLNYLDEFLPKSYDKNESIQTLNKTLQKAQKENDKALKIKTLIATSAFNRINLDYNTAFDDAGEALFLAEELQETVLLAKAHENFGILQFLFRQNDLALENFSKSLNYFEKAYNEQLTQKADLYHANYNMMLYYQRIKDIKLMNHHLETCYEILNTTNLEPTLVIYLDSEQSVNEMRAGKYHNAETLLKESINTLNELKPNTKVYKLNFPYIVSLYVNLARLHERREDEVSAGKYFKLATDNITMNGDLAFYNSWAYASYASWLYRQGDYYKAYINIKNAKQINDNYQNARRPNNQGFLTIRDRYSEELQKKNEELNQQNLELAENKQEILRTRIILVAILLLIAVAAFIVRSRMQFLKHQKENEINRKKEQQAQEMLEHKNRELTSTMLQLIEKEEILDSVAEHLKTNDDKSKSIKYLNSLRKQSVNLWDEFNSRFIEQNEGFYERLQEKVPGLSSNDLKICALIKLNFSGKEMATLLGISMGSVHVARHRLRKKMDIDRDVNLTGFINSI